MNRLISKSVFKFIALISFLCVSSLSLAKPPAYPGANGQPFQALQEQIDARTGEGYDAIVMVYGLCNNGIVGLEARDTFKIVTQGCNQ